MGKRMHLLSAVLATVVLFTVLPLNLPVSAARMSRVTASNEWRGIEIKWTALADVQSYMVTRTLQKNGVMIDETVVDPRTYDTAVMDVCTTDGMIYAYTVKVLMRDGTLVKSRPVRIRRLSAPDIDINRVVNGMLVSWGKIPNAKNYRVYRSVSVKGGWSKWKKLKTTSKLEYLDKSVKSGVTYRCVVKGYNGKYISSNKSTMNFKW